MYWLYLYGIVLFLFTASIWGCDCSYATCNNVVRRCEGIRSDSCERVRGCSMVTGCGETPCRDYQDSKTCLTGPSCKWEIYDVDRGIGHCIYKVEGTYDESICDYADENSCVDSSVCVWGPVCKGEITVDCRSFDNQKEICNDQPQCEWVFVDRSCI